jgi:hypothetical protein
MVEAGSLGYLLNALLGIILAGLGWAFNMQNRRLSAIEDSLSKKVDYNRLFDIVQAIREAGDIQNKHINKLEDRFNELNKTVLSSLSTGQAD